ncbi:scavenger receptor cysteine-rich type 1 protein M130 [Genypterus blacodes]|uniref:scavenger receptor cysteine-rich type 1 protein M130 n=1 Tax=Genypterus blacodes TaxID=154954 RepID=UPI003F76FB30
MKWILLFLLCTAQPEPLTSQVDRLILRDGENPCEGYIEILHDNRWGLVGNVDNDWTLANENVACSSINCGLSMNESKNLIMKDHDGKRTVWLSTVDCSQLDLNHCGSKCNLWDCAFPGWGIPPYYPHTVKKIKCKDRVEFKLHGSPCAGAVQFNKSGTSGYVCGDNWDKDHADLLCKSLNCGNHKQIPADPSRMTPKQFSPSSNNNIKIKCSGTNHEKSLWHCAPTFSQCSKPATVICSDHERLQLSGNSSNVCSGQLEVEENNAWQTVRVQNNKTTPELRCKQMNCGTAVISKGTQLTCSDHVNIILRNAQNSTCHGRVYTKVNNKESPVCGSPWVKENAEVVCRELNCGKVIETSSKPSTGETGLISDVSCSGREASLWHCLAKRHDSDSFRCSSVATVVCANSVASKLLDSPGKCAGRLEIRYEDKWKAVRQNEWRLDESNIVCKSLGCGNAREVTADKFIRGSSPFLHKALRCGQDSKSLGDCIFSGSTSAQPEHAVITCEAHRVVFLKGSLPCSGMVGIEHGDNNYWLSGSNETWHLEAANDVCRRMHCGEQKEFQQILGGAGKDIWRKSNNCSKKSLLACGTQSRTDNNDTVTTIATVTCTGNITVNLTNKCWGLVQVCIDGVCGGVCEETWSESKSDMLCKDLGCGKGYVLSTEDAAHFFKPQSNVPISSLHATKQTTRLADSNMVRISGSKCSQVSVVCSGSAVPKFENSTNFYSDKCSGNLEMFYLGDWRPVCHKALENEEARNIICNALQCGQSGKDLQYIGPHPSSQVSISKLSCLASTDSLAECNIGHQMSTKSDCDPGGLQCFDWRKMTLKHTPKACAGPVFVHSEGTVSPVSSEGWTEEEGQVFCKHLNCGNFTSKEEKHEIISQKALWPKTFKCSEGKQNPTSIWDCEATGTSSHTEQLHINCKDEPKITLSNTCYGEVQINGIGVCSTNWNDKYSHFVCQEMKCGGAIKLQSLSVGKAARKPAYRVSCQSYNYRLGQCRRWESKESCELVSVYCTKNVIFNTTENCGGQIRVSYGRDWQEVCPHESFPVSMKDKLCDKLGCTKAINNPQSKYKEKANLEMKLDCSGADMQIEFCVKQESCKASKPAEIYCQGYVSPPELSEAPINYALIVSLAVLCLIIVFVIVALVLVKLKKKLDKKDKKIKYEKRPPFRREEELESGDYEDVAVGVNEMNVFSPSERKLTSSAISEKDVMSTSSLSYDDIDNNDEPLIQRLNSERRTSSDSDSEDSCANNGAQSEDVATYEVDETSYDDIAAAPEISQTEAEVYQNHQTKSDYNTEDSVGGEHYLRPDMMVDV